MLSMTPRECIRQCLKWIRYRREVIVLLFGFVSVGALAFEAGVIHGVSRLKEPIRIELAPENLQKNTGVSNQEIGGGGEKYEQIAQEVSEGNTLTTPPGACAFVASRNSTLYHAVSCGVAKRIKETNKLCFKDVAEAEKRGFKPGCLK